MKNSKPEPINLVLSTKLSVDTSAFDDPMAQKVDWESAQNGFSSGNRRLVSINLNRVAFRSSIIQLVPTLAFAAIGIAVIYDFFVELSAGEFSTGSLAFFLIFAGLAWMLFHIWATPIVFDKSKGYFWKGRKAPRPPAVQAVTERWAPIEEIYALQLIRRIHHGSRRSKTSYQLNLVLRSGERIYVVGHRNKKKLGEDAATLSAFLQKTVWDAS